MVLTDEDYLKLQYLQQGVRNRERMKRELQSALNQHTLKGVVSAHSRKEQKVVLELGSDE